MEFQPHVIVANHILDGLKAKGSTYEKEIAPIAEALGDALYSKARFQEANDAYRNINVDSPALYVVRSFGRSDESLLSPTHTFSR